MRHEAIMTLALALCAGSGLAEDATLRFHGQSVQVLAAGSSDRDCPAATNGGARICLQPSGACYQQPGNFGFRPKAHPITIAPGHPVVLFSAIQSGCGSGSTERVSLLAPHNNAMVDLLPDVKISEQGEVKTWYEPAVSKSVLVVTADALWGENETHFSRHYFKITVYAMAKDGLGYTERDSYTTSKTYPSLDDANEIEVLRYERARVRSRLLRVH